MTDRFDLRSTPGRGCPRKLRRWAEEEGVWLGVGMVVGLDELAEAIPLAFEDRLDKKKESWMTVMALLEVGGGTERVLEVAVARGQLSTSP